MAKANSSIDDWLEAMCARWEPASQIPVEVFLREHFPDAPPEVQEAFRRLVSAEEELSRFFPPSDPTGSPDSAGPGGERIGKYELVAELGRGGMGRVYLARDPDLGREVALKVILGTSAAGGGRWERFQREVKTLGRLSHPHIVTVHHSGMHNGCPFFVMEAAEQGSLVSFATQVNPPGQVAQLVVLLARAIAVAHEAGVLHRDLKPHNVLLAKPAPEPALNCVWGWPKIADFGLSKEINTPHDLTASGVPLGTLAYMAPEQVRGELTAHGFATDVYGLGTILYQMLTGRPPFGATATYDQIYTGILTRAPDPPSKYNGSVSPALDAICLKCLAKDPAERFATARDLEQSLVQWLADQHRKAPPAKVEPRLPPSEPTSAPGGTKVEPRQDRPAPKRRRIAVAMILLAITGALGIGLWIDNNRAGIGPVLVLTVPYPNADTKKKKDVDAKKIEQEVAIPLEEYIKGCEGMERFESISGNNACVVHVYFKPGTDTELATVLLQNRANLVEPTLPYAVKERLKEDQQREAKARGAGMPAIGAHTSVFPVKLGNAEYDPNEVGVAIEAKDDDDPETAQKMQKAADVVLERFERNGILWNKRQFPQKEKQADQSTIYRVNTRRAIRITGFPKNGDSLGDASRKCVAEAKDELKSTKLIVEEVGLVRRKSLLGYIGLGRSP